MVVGAGPAGSATALALAEQGWRIKILDRRPRIEQKICGECLSPPSRDFLKRLGVWDQLSVGGIHELAGIKLVGFRGSSCSLDFGTDRPFTIPRPTLDAALLEEAKKKGVDIRFGTEVTRLVKEKDTYQVLTRNGESFKADLVIGADGRQSFIARHLGMGPRRKKHSLQHAAVMGHFSQPDCPLQGVEMHMSPWGYVGLNPLPNQLINVIVVCPPEILKTRLKREGGGKKGLISFLNQHVQGEYAPRTLRERMKGSEAGSEKTWSVSSIAWTPRRLVAPHLALVGDSAGFIDPFTGEGLYHSLASAVRLAEFVKEKGPADGLDAYASWHKQTFGPEETFCYLLQKLLPFSRTADYALRQLERKSNLKKILAEAIADRIPIQRVLSPIFWGKVLWPS